MRARFLQRTIGVVGAALLLASTTSPASAAPAQAELPSSYTVSSGAQGLGFLVTFTGSTIAPLVNAASPYALTTLSSSVSPNGLATVAFPGTVGLIAGDALPILAPGAGSIVAPFVPAYPLVARADGRDRNSVVGAPKFQNGTGTLQGGVVRQTCTVAADDSAVECAAYGANLVVPAPSNDAISDYLGIPEPQGAASDPISATTNLVADRLSQIAGLEQAASFTSKRESRGGVLGRLGLVNPLADEEPPPLIKVDSMQALSNSKLTEAGAVAESITTMNGFSIAGGLIEIDGVDQRLDAVSDGETAESSGVTDIGDIRIAGIPVTVNEDGVSVAEANAIPGSQIASTNELLNSVLAEAGIVMRMGTANDSTSGASAGYESDGLYLAVNVGIGVTIYTVRAWLGSGRVQAFQAAPPPSFEAPASLSSGGSSAAPSSFQPANPTSTFDSLLPPSGGSVPTSGGSSLSTSSPTAIAPSRLVAFLGGDTGLAQGTLLAMFLAWQFLGLGTLTAAGRRVRVGN